MIIILSSRRVRLFLLVLLSLAVCATGVMALAKASTHDGQDGTSGAAVGSGFGRNLEASEHGGAQQSGSTPGPARAWLDSVVIPAYEEGLPDANPPFDLFVPVTGGRLNYPYTLRNNLTDVRTDKTWRALWLENEYLKCLILPDLGGHLYSCTDKRNGQQMFYANPPSS